MVMACFNGHAAWKLRKGPSENLFFASRPVHRPMGRAGVRRRGARPARRRVTRHLILSHLETAESPRVPRGRESRVEPCWPNPMMAVNRLSRIGSCSATFTLYIFHIMRRSTIYAAAVASLLMPRCGKCAQSLAASFQPACVHLDTSGLHSSTTSWHQTCLHVAAPDVEPSDQGRGRLKRRRNARYPSRKKGNFFNTQLNNLAKKEIHGAAEEAERLLFDRLRAVSDPSSSNTNSKGGGYDIASFNIVLNAWSKCGNAPRAAALLGRMEHLCDLGILPFAPNEISYSTVADAWARSGEDGNKEEAGKVLDILKDMRKDSNERQSRGREDLVSFNMELDMLAREGCAEAAETAELMLFDELREAATTAATAPSSLSLGDYIGCDIISFNCCLNAWSKCGNAQRAAALLGRLEHLSDTFVLPFGPNSVSYATCIDGWAKSGLARAPFEAEALLDRVESAYSYSDQMIEDEGRHPAIVPTVHMYSSCVNAWSHSKRSDAARRAEKILNRLEDLHACGKEQYGLVKPNSILYSAVITCWAKSKEKDAVFRAESLLKRMKDSNNADMKPTEFTYSALINAWANSGQGTKAAERADELVKEVEHDDELEPNVFIYTNAIKAWARSGHPECGVRAESILERMLAAGDIGASPNLYSFTAAIDAWISQGGTEGPRNAERLLQKMIELTKGGYNKTGPDMFIYSKVIKALESSNDADAISRAGNLRKQWKQ